MTITRDVFTPESLKEEAERLVSYWEIHGEQPEVVARWAMHDLLPFVRRVAEEN